jgi:hypothetical protein
MMPSVGKVTALLARLLSVVGKVFCFLDSGNKQVNIYFSALKMPLLANRLAYIIFGTIKKVYKLIKFY